MKQRMLIFLGLIFLVILLVGLNAATYVQKEKIPDTEFVPNRSSYNSGTTGTQAFFALLSETGRRVRRWQEPLDTIAARGADQPSVFVMIGPLRRGLTDVENTKLMEWVSSGGTLLLIDREPSPQLALTTAQWQIAVNPATNADLFSVDSSDTKQMIADTPAHKPSLPSSLSHGVNSVQSSRFASSITVDRFRDIGSVANAVGSGSGSGTGVGSGVPQESPTPIDFYSSAAPPPPPPASNKSGEPELQSDEDSEAEADYASEYRSFDAPVIHLGGRRNLLVEAPFGSGRVIILSDPYIVSNIGINQVDNSRLAVNLVSSQNGLIAFDEYHHGHGTNNNPLFRYFEGTPVVSIFLQCGLLIALVFFSQSRRFARPVPEAEPSRLSKLEYVSAMAELQQRTRAYDLAIENIYSDFRRRVCVMLGLDNTSASRREIAERVAERIGASGQEIEDLLFRCEDVIHGEPVTKRVTMELVDKIRGLEQKLGLKRSGRKGV